MRPLMALLLLASLTAARGVPPDWPRTLPSAKSDRLEAWFLGNTTLLFRAGDQAVMIDGFLSRPTFWRFAFGKLSSDAGLLKRCLSSVGIAVDDGPGAKLEAVLVSHGHYDHALDAAQVAELTGAKIVGAPSTLAVLPPRDDSPQGESVELGRFTVHRYQFTHSRPNLFPGRAAREVKQPARVGEFRDDESSAFHITIDGIRILVHPSAGFEPGAYGSLQADVVFLSFGGLGIQPWTRVRDYWNAVVGGRGARLVVPIHWDRINRPLSQGFARSFLAYAPQPAMRQITRLAVGGPALRLMPFFRPVDLRAAIEPPVPAGPDLSLGRPKCADPKGSYSSAGLALSWM